MNDHIREILSWYDSDNAGVRTNLARMLNHGRLVDRQNGHFACRPGL